MIAYLYDIKTKIRTQEQTVDALENELFANKDKPGSPSFPLLPGFTERQPTTDLNGEIPEADDWEIVSPKDSYDPVNCDSVGHLVSC